MSTKNEDMAASTAAGASGGPGNRTAAISIDYYDVAWYIIDKIAMVIPSSTITIKARQEIKIEIGDDAAIIGHNGITLKSGDRVIDIDPRYNAAVEHNKKTVAVSGKIKYRGNVYEVKDFVELFKKRVRELIDMMASHWL
jgi:hypothetical protein